MRLRSHIWLGIVLSTMFGTAACSNEPRESSNITSTDQATDHTLKELSDQIDELENRWIRMRLDYSEKTPDSAARIKQLDDDIKRRVAVARDIVESLERVARRTDLAQSSQDELVRKARKEIDELERALMIATRDLESKKQIPVGTPPA